MGDNDFDVSIDTSEFSEESGLYANQEQADAKGVTLETVSGDSSDEVDPRKLVRDPTLSEIRWYYRRTFAKMLVDKPIEDAFKNSFEFTGESADEAQSLIDSDEAPRYGKRGNFIDALQMARKKARRDGFALIFLGAVDTSEGIHTSPISEDITVDRIGKLQVLTIDDLTESGGAAHEQIREGTGLDRDQYEVRQTGIVLNVDPESSEFKEPVGYMLGGASPKFIHADRVLHYVSNPEVDGDYDHNFGVRRFDHRSSTVGEYEGDSVLIPSYDLLKGVVKGNWSIMQSLFRDASHMYSVELPEDANEDDFDQAVHATTNINSKSALVTPFGYDIQQHESGNELDPSNHFEVIFNQICAVHEMTKSVLFGTQAGTVSGSETDIKNYFNKVERMRSSELEDDIFEYLTRVKRMLDSRTSDTFEFDGADIDWGPLFKVDSDTRLQMFQTQAQAIGTLIGQYVITPDEARSILTEEWAHIDFDDLTQDQMDVLDRLNLAQVGQFEGAEANDPEPETPQTGGQQGGRPAGGRQSPEGSGTTPTDSSLDGLSHLHDEGHLTDEEFTEAVKAISEQD